MGVSVQWGVSGATRHDCEEGRTIAMTSPRSDSRHVDSAHLLSLETLAYKYGTDKSKDDHKYVDIYHSLLADRRQHIRNVTEIGVAAGQSIAIRDGCGRHPRHSTPEY